MRVRRIIRFMSAIKFALIRALPALTAAALFVAAVARIVKPSTCHDM